MPDMRNHGPEMFIGFTERKYVEKTKLPVANTWDIVRSYLDVDKTCSLSQELNGFLWNIRRFTTCFDTGCLFPSLNMMP